MELSPSILDNDKTQTYKWAVERNVPVRLVVVKRAPPESESDQELELLSTLVSRFPPGTDIQTIVDSFQDALVQVRLEDILMTWLKLNGGPTQDNLIRINDWYQATSSVTKYANLDALEAEIQDWNLSVQTDLEANINYVNQIVEAQSYLEGVAPAPSTDIQIDTLSIIVRLLSFDTDPLDAFNKLLVSPETPFVSYLPSRDSDKYYSKLYALGNESLSSLIVRQDSVRRDNTYIIKVRTTDLDAEPEYTTAYLSLESMQLYFTTELANQDRILSRLQMLLTPGFPNLEWQTTNIVRVTGEFYIFDQDIYMPGFLHQMLTDEVFKLYVYVDESGKPQALKNTLSLRYISGTYTNAEDADYKVDETITCSVKEIVATSPKPFTLSDGSTKTVAPDEKYLSFSIRKASSAKVLSILIRVISRLFGLYQQDRQDPQNIEWVVYKPLFPLLSGPSADLQPQTQESTKREADTDKLRKLSSIAPDVFIRRYGRKCQRILQPIILRTKQEQQAWVKEKFEYKGQLINRQIMPFPRPNPDGTLAENTIFIGCDKNNYPFPGVKKNDLGNKDKYPYIPCCFESDQMSPNNQKSDYNIYYKGFKEPSLIERIKGQIKNPQKKPSILEPYRLGRIPLVLEKALNAYKGSIHRAGHVLFRMGVPSSISSLLHCICEAIGDDRYLALPIEDRELYVDSLRKQIARSVGTAVLKQELWDVPDEQITRDLADENVFLDPLLYYRAFEEYYEINIYTFSFTGDTDASIEVPRCYSFHSRTFRERPTILIMRHRGTGSESAEIPQCELIVDTQSKMHYAIRLFDEAMNKVCANLLMNSRQVVTFSFDNNVELRGRMNISFGNSMYPLIPSATGQYIDLYGKMRALVFPVNNTQVSVAFPGQQPEYISSIRIDEIPRSTHELAIEIFGQPVGTTRSTADSNVVTGLWYTFLDIFYGVYVPVVYTRDAQLLELPVGPPDPLLTDQSNSLTDKLYRLRYTVQLIVQVIEYLYDLSGLGYQEFMDRYTIVPNKQPDPFSIYKPTVKSLPVVATVQEGIRDLSRSSPSWFQNGKIVIYNSNLWTKLSYRLKVYEKTKQPGKRKTQLNVWFSDKDFTPRDNTFIFSNDRDMINWIASRNAKTDFRILDTINQTMAVSYDPYVYRNSNGQMYLVQNVFAGNLYRALTVASLWLQSNINYGSGNLKPVEVNPESASLAHLIYGISRGSTLVPIIDNTKGQELYIEVLCYSDNPAAPDAKFAAMLPLLLPED